MKKIYLLLIFSLFGCMTIQNDNCITTRKFEILQALNDGGALAYECNFWDGCSPFNQLVYLEGQPGIRYYDGMILKVQSNKCAIIDDVYKYTTREGILKTVPSIKIDYKSPPSSNEEFIKRVEEISNGVYVECLHDFKTNNSGDGEKFCKCTTNTIIDYFIDLTSEENVKYSQEIIESEVEKKCGKIPEFYNL